MMPPEHGISQEFDSVSGFVGLDLSCLWAPGSYSQSPVQRHYSASSVRVVPFPQLLCKTSHTPLGLCPFDGFLLASSIPEITSHSLSL